MEVTYTLVGKCCHLITNTHAYSRGNVPIPDKIPNASGDVGSVAGDLQVEDVDDASSVENVLTNDIPQNLSNLDVS